MPRIILALIVFSLIAPGATHADEPDSPAVPGVGELTEPQDERTMGLDVGVGFSQIAEDSFIDTNLGFTFGLGKFSFGLLVPLRIRVIDDPPENDSAIREQDWDEASDYMRVLRFVQYGSRQDTFFARAGELSGVVLGHGTIVSGYNNVVDVNHFQWGLTGAVNLNIGGSEVLLDNLIDPDIMGLRLYVRPWQFIDPESYWTNLAFGVSLIGDIDAPQSLQLATDGTFVVDDEHNLVVAESEGTGVLGFDVELQAFTNDLVSLTPYTDVNVHLGHGTGLYIGNLANFSFTDAVALNTRLEFRVLGEGHYPTYFDDLYELERLLFRPLDPTGQRRPKLQVLDLDPPDSRLGWYGEGTLGILGMVFVTAGYEDYQGDDNSSFFARLALSNLGPVTLGAYYVNQNFDGVGEFFDLDNALLVSEVRVGVWGPLYVIGQFSRRFSAQEDGTYEPVDDWGVGVGASFSF